MKRRVFIYTLLMLLTLLATACQIDLANPPRLATAAAKVPDVVPEVLHLPAPTATPGTSLPAQTVVPDQNDERPSITIWVNEVSPEHEQLLSEMAAEFSDQQGSDVAIQLVNPALLPELVSTAVLSGTLPDIIVHPLEFTAGWAEGGILDTAAADEVVAGLGHNTFDPEALELVNLNGQPAAIPVYGAYQLLLFRQDWFEDQDLKPPVDFESMFRAAEKLHDPDNLISGLVIPTESNLITTHQAFEQFALANGCQLVEESGEVKLLAPQCTEALEHYHAIINQFSPPGVQTDVSAQNAFLEGLTGMIMTSPAILPALAGVPPGPSPSCQGCEIVDGVNSLSQQTGIVTQIAGNVTTGEPTAFANLTNIGITTVADRETAQAFVTYWLKDAYERWLTLDSERKVPMRLGTDSEPRRYIDAWGLTAIGQSDLSLTDIYGAETVRQLREGVAAAPRWGIREGSGDLVTRMHDDYVFPIVLQEMLSGYFGPDETLREVYGRVIDLVPNYTFPIEPEDSELEPET